MINGNAKLEFGTGDISILSQCNPDSGILYFKNQEPKEIGVFEPMVEDYEYDSAEVVMTFTKVESIDTLIEQLLFAKRRMNGELI